MMGAFHLAVMDSDGDWQSACGTHTQRTTEKLADVTCLRCRRSGAFRAEDGDDFTVRRRSANAIPGASKGEK